VHFTKNTHQLSHSFSQEFAMSNKTDTTLDDFDALRKSLDAWENCDPDDFDDTPPYLVHHMSRLAFYAKRYLQKHGPREELDDAHPF
jgi:hypothetical protein